MPRLDKDLDGLSPAEWRAIRYMHADPLLHRMTLLDLLREVDSWPLGRMIDQPSAFVTDEEAGSAHFAEMLRCAATLQARAAARTRPR